MTTAVDLGRTASLQRRELFLWLFWGGVAITAQRYFHVGNEPLFWRQLGQINVFLVGALGVVAYRLCRYRETRAASLRDIALVSLLVLLLVSAGLLPRLIGVGAFFFCFALWLSRINDSSRELFAAAIVLCAIATHVLFAPIVFRSFLPFFVQADALLLGYALQILNPNVVWSGIHFSQSLESGKFGIVLAGACSSFNAVSAAVIVHLTWAMAMRKHLTKWDGVALLATLIFATALNVARLVLTAQSQEGYDFWHGGTGAFPVGALIFISVQNLALIAAGYATARWAGPTDR